MSNDRYRQVLEPLRVGRLTFRNRIVMPAHTTNFGNRHLPTRQHLEYHRERARGGVGAIIFESIRVTRNSLGRPQCVSGFDEETVEAFRPIVEAVHAEGVPLLGQVIHVGRQIDGDFERTVSFGPSTIPWAATAAPPHQMNEDDMQEVIDGHILTARNLVEAGFDGFEIHCGHGHLLQQFLSPLSNARTDSYGGSIENRARFPNRVLRAVRDAVGPDVCVGIRMSADEYHPQGYGLDYARKMLPILIDGVQIDFVNVSHSAYHGSVSLATQMADMALPAAMFRPNPKAMKEALSQAGRGDIPVFAVCKFRTLDEAEEALRDGIADAIGMARAHLAEPELVKKSLEGRHDEIRPCIGCNQGCAAMNEKNLPLRCTVNPRSGLESTWEDLPAIATRQPKKVLVVGGGPAGMEAAWVAAGRGHRVTLWERSPVLGGQLRSVEAMPLRHDFLKLLDHQRGRLAMHGVEIETGRAATPETIADFGADQVVLATGARPAPLPAWAGEGAFGLVDALTDADALGERVAFLDQTGSWASIAAIEHFADLGKSVEVFVPASGFAWRATIYSTLANGARLREKGVKIRLLRRITGWKTGTVQSEDLSDGTAESLPGFSSLVVSATDVASDDLYRPLRASGIPVKMVGDCLAPRTAMEAVFEGHEFARQI